MKGNSLSAGKLPGKTSMNFARRKKKFRPRVMIPLILILIGAALAAAKFAFIDPLGRKAAAYDGLSSRREELASAAAAVKDYDSVAEKYGKYSYGYLTNEEASTADRMKAISLVESIVASAASVSDFSISGNTISIDADGISLEQMGAVVKKLEASELVSTVTVQTAASDGNGTAAGSTAQRAAFALTVTLADAKEASWK